MIETTFRVGRRWKVTMALPDRLPHGVLEIDAVWDPAAPARRLNKRELADYRRGRDAFLAEAARLMGGSALVVE